MNYLNAFALVNKMNKFQILADKFKIYAKYLGIITVIAFLTFLILNAFNTGNENLFWISYISLMISFIGLIQFACLHLIIKYYEMKSK